MKRIVHVMAGVAIGVLMTTIAFAVSSAKRAAQDPVKQSPQYYKVLLENEQVRVLEYRLKPGEKEPMHAHTQGVVYIFGDAKLKTTFPDGRTEEFTGGAGEAHWRDPVTHALENTGKTDAHALAVEIKKPCKQ
jgi:quercetin dioxygenase-like cupin family protein